MEFIIKKIVFKKNGQVERNIDLVYGGGSIGLMGLVSQAVYDGGRHVLGYHPSSFSSPSPVIVFE